MNVREYEINKIYKVLGIVEYDPQQEERQTLINDPWGIVRYNVAEANTWYNGISDEILNFYTDNTMFGQYVEEPIYARNKRNYFWSVASTENNIKRTHSGMPRDIIDTLVNVCGDPMISNDDGLEKILEDLEFWDTYKNEQMPLTLVEGWGAYKIGWDNISRKLELKYYKANDVDFIKKNSRVIGLIFKDYYVAKDGTNYMVCETRYLDGTDLIIMKDVFIKTQDELTPVTEIKEAGIEEVAYKIVNANCLLAQPCVFFYDTSGTGAFGRSVFSGKYDQFDDLDQCHSQCANTVRKSTPHEYIDMEYVARDPKTGAPLMPKAYDRSYTSFKGGLDAEGNQSNRDPIFVTQPKLDALNFQTAAVNIMLQIINGLLSPATMGIDIAKKDNADAQREKEKVTIFTRNAILRKETRILRNLFNQMLIAQAYLNDPDKGICYVDYDISIKYGEFADDSYENKLITLGEALMKGSLSPKMYLSKLYGDTLSKEEYDEELAFLTQRLENPFGDKQNVTGNEDNPFGEEQASIEENDF